MLELTAPIFKDSTPPYLSHRHSLDIFPLVEGLLADTHLPTPSATSVLSSAAAIPPTTGSTLPREPIVERSSPFSPPVQPTMLES